MPPVYIWSDIDYARQTFTFDAYSYLYINKQYSIVVKLHQCYYIWG